MEFLMRGIIVLSLVGTALCLASVAHWDSGLAEPHVVLPFDRAPAHKQGVRFTREVPSGDDQAYIPHIIEENVLVNREKRSPRTPKLIEPTYKPGSSNQPRLIHPTYKFHPTERTYGF